MSKDKLTEKELMDEIDRARFANYDAVTQLKEIVKWWFLRNDWPKNIAKLQQKTVTKKDVFKIIEATIDCKDVDTLIQRYTIIFKELGIMVED